MQSSHQEAIMPYNIILNLTVLAKKVVGLITHNTNLVAITKFLLTFVF